MAFTDARGSKPPSLSACLASPLQSPRSAAFILPRICSIHLHLGNRRDFLRTFIFFTGINNIILLCHCLLCSQSVALFLYSSFFALFQSLAFIVQSVQWGARQRGYADTTERKINLVSSSLLSPLSFFFFFTLHPTLPLFYPLVNGIIIFKKAVADFLSDMFFFIQNQLLNSAKQIEKKKPSPFSVFLLRRLGRTPGRTQRCF